MPPQNSVIWRGVQGLILQRRLFNPRHLLTASTRYSLSSEPPKNDDSPAKPPFSGEIPPDELKFTYCKSSGPGGQHVNKAATKVEVRFSIEKASWIPDWIKPRLQEKEANRITKKGEFVITSEKTRKQILNQADALNRLRTIIFDVSKLPKEKTPEEIELADKRKAKRAAAILKEKRQDSLTKSMRGSL